MLSYDYRKAAIRTNDKLKNHSGRLNSASLDMIIVRLLPLFCLTTLLQNAPVLTYINRVLIIPVLFLVLASLFMSSVKRWVYVSVLLYLAVSVLACAFTTWTSQILVAAPRGLFCITMLMWAATRHDALKAICFQNVSYYRMISIVWTLLVAISIPMPSSWTNTWGSGTYFSSYLSSAFQLAPTAMVVMSLNIICAAGGQKYSLSLLLSIVPLFVGIQGGSRTYFFLLVLTVIFLIMVSNVSRKTRRITFIALVFGGTLFFAGSGLSQKFLNTMSADTQHYSGFDALGAFTSGRSVFWAYDINAFFNLPLWQQFIGNGYSFPYEVNAEMVGNEIYAHNDFINLIMESGYIGISVYLAAVAYFFKKMQSVYLHSRFVFILMLFSWFFNAFFNSFYPYTSSVISLVLLAVGLELWVSRLRTN